MNYKVNSNGQLKINKNAFEAWITIVEGKVVELYVQNPTQFCKQVVTASIAYKNKPVAIQDAQLLVNIVSTMYQVDLTPIVQEVANRGKIEREELVGMYDQVVYDASVVKLLQKENTIEWNSNIEEEEDMVEEVDKVEDCANMKTEDWNNLLMENVMVCKTV